MDSRESFLPGWVGIGFTEELLGQVVANSLQGELLPRKVANISRESFLPRQVAICLT
jgi:hypothetical protein